MNECFEAGLIDAELFTEDESMRDAKLMSETPIVGSAPGWTADATFGANAYQYVALPALKGPSGNQYICSDPEHWNMSRYEFVVTSACKDPGPLLAWADRFYTDDASIQNFYGSFGVGVEKNEDGTYMVLPPKDGNSADTFAWISSLRDFGPKYVDDGFNDKVKYAAENGDAAKLELDRELAKYAKEAPEVEELLMHPTVGWISGFDLSGDGEAKIYDGTSGESYSDRAVAMYIKLPENNCYSYRMTIHLSCLICPCLDQLARQSVRR